MINRFFIILSIIIISCINSADRAQYTLDIETKKKLIDTIISCTIDKYVSLDLALKVRKYLSENSDNNLYKNITDPQNFADSITKHLQEITRDKHFRLIYYADTVPDPKNKFQNNLKYYDSLNYGFRKLDILEGNVGYLKIDGFLPSYEDTVNKLAINSMQILNKTEAIIFDLRENIGGDESLVKLFLSFLLDTIQIHYSNDYVRFLNETYEQWTLSEIPVQRFINKPVFVLTSKKTFSAGEYFAYNLQALNRAIIVGDTTRGGANGCLDMEINEHFLLKLPFMQTKNIITQTDWEGIGVIPDIKISSENALSKAYTLAINQIDKKELDSGKERSGNSWQ